MCTILYLFAKEWGDRFSFPQNRGVTLPTLHPDFVKGCFARTWWDRVPRISPAELPPASWK